MLWDPRKNRSEAAAPGAAAVADAGQAFPTKALRKFLNSLTSREAPVLLDLGPVVGSNLEFFGERLGCKILIEDLFADLDRYPQQPDALPFAEYLETRLKHAPDTVDGVLCWNLFDFLDLRSAQALGRVLTRLVRPDGSVLAFFSTIAQEARFAKFLIVDENTIKQKPYSAARKQKAYQNRDVIRLFEGMKVAESFLLKTNIREFLFRKQ